MELINYRATFNLEEQGRIGGLRTKKAFPMHYECYKKKTTPGWDLEVEWATSWLPLRELKVMNMIEVAEYEKSKSIIDKPAIDWWNLLLIKKSHDQSRHQTKGYHA